MVSGTAETPQVGPAVLIVGAGPVGLSAALLLARHGTPVRIIDRDAGPTDLSKAAVVWQRTLETLNPVLPYHRFTADHPALQRVCLGFGRKVVVDFPSGPAGPPACVLVPQSSTERILIDRLAELGVSVERNTELTGFTSDDQGVDCDIAGPHGRQRMRTPWLVACDGAHSTVRHLLGLTFPGKTVHSRWMLADIEVAADPEPDQHEIHMNLSSGVAALFPMGGGRWRLIASVETEPGGVGAEPATFSIDEIQSVLDSRSDLRWSVSSCHWSSEFGINERQVDQYVHGRVLLAGDAAHVHSPAGGQGMNTGIQDVANLAWKIALVERGAAPAELLASYQSERHPVGAAVVRQSARLLKAGTVTGPQRFARDHVAPLALSVPAVRDRLIGFLTEVSVNYRGGSLADGTGSKRGLRSGDRWPLTNGAEAELVLIGDAASGRAPERFGGKAGFPLTVTRADSDAPVAQASGRTSGAVVIRPDGVVASIGPDASSAASWTSEKLQPVQAL